MTDEAVENVTDFSITIPQRWSITNVQHTRGHRRHRRLRLLPAHRLGFSVARGQLGNEHHCVLHHRRHRQHHLRTLWRFALCAIKNIVSLLGLDEAWWTNITVAAMICLSFATQSLVLPRKNKDS